jgi:L-fucose mutarotase/ribose pyranase (RbsD/FucU family)
MMLFAAGLLFWQLRAGPAAQLLAIPAAAFAAQGAIRAIVTGRLWMRVAGVAAALVVAAILFIYPLYPQFNSLLAAVKGERPVPAKPATTNRREAIRKANGRCRTLPALEVLDQLRPATIFTMVDLGPRLIATTHHSALAGPYHRNGAAILDIHHAFDGPADGFRPIAARHHATYLLVCPNFPEGTIYQSRSPRGFYAGLMRGQVPGWLRPVRLKTGMTLPYQLYRIDYSAAPNSALGSKKGPEQR